MFFSVKILYFSLTWVYFTEMHQDFGLLGCDTVSPGKYLPTFRKVPLSPIRFKLRFLRNVSYRLTVDMA